ncbi:MAG TPA: YceI family protein [Micromonosporaceae bacterium]|nr:YceI family protein [Micromonosporaceae bacterium]
MSTQVNTPGYLAGTWVIDAVHSDVSFQVRYFGVAKLCGSFDDFEGTIVTAENPLDSSVNAVIRTASVNTKNTARDDNLRQADFLDVDQYPTMTFASTGVRVDGDRFLVDGDLTIRAVTKQVTLNLEFNGVGAGFTGKPLVGFSAYGEISRNEFGVAGGPMAAAVSDKVRIAIEIAAHKQD